MSDEKRSADQAGPCVVCGRTNYPLSMGGPTICPSCDCGYPPYAKVHSLCAEVEQLKAQLKALNEPVILSEWQQLQRRCEAAEAQLAERDRQWSDALWPENPEGAEPCTPEEAKAHIKAVVAYERSGLEAQLAALRGIVERLPVQEIWFHERWIKIVLAENIDRLRAALSAPAQPTAEERVSVATSGSVARCNLCPVCGSPMLYRIGVDGNVVTMFCQTHSCPRWLREEPTATAAPSEPKPKAAKPWKLEYCPECNGSGWVEDEVSHCMGGYPWLLCHNPEHWTDKPAADEPTPSGQGHMRHEAGPWCRRCGEEWPCKAAAEQSEDPRQ